MSVTSGSLGPESEARLGRSGCRHPLHPSSTQAEHHPLTPPWACTSAQHAPPPAWVNSVCFGHQSLPVPLPAQPARRAVPLLQTPPLTRCFVRLWQNPPVMTSQPFSNSSWFSHQETVLQRSFVQEQRPRTKSAFLPSHPRQQDKQIETHYIKSPTNTSKAI